MISSNVFAWLNRRGLILWTLLLLALLGGALAKRHVEHRALCRELAAQLDSAGRKGGNLLLDVYLWGGGCQLPNGNWYYEGSVQGPAVYLLRYGYMDDALARQVLLAEAQRVYDWKYLYSMVNNYDLRRIVAQRSLRAFTNDPLVQCAAGELDLAAADYESAEHELSRALDLAAAGPGGVQAFCHANERSEEHLRGRLAAVLTMLGKWDEADEQSVLANAVGDGAVPPEAVTGEMAVYLNEDELAKYKVEEVAVQKRRQIAMQYAASHDQRLIQPWIDQYLDAKNMWHAISDRPPDGQDNSKAIALSDLAGLYQASIIRAYLLSHEWDKASKYLEEVFTPGYDSPEWFAETLKIETGFLLTRLATHKKLGETAREYLADWISGLGPDSELASDPWAVGINSRGEFADLLESDYLPFLLRTDGFADALARSGRKLPDVLAEVRAVTQPQRDNYEDYSNGPLPQRLRAEAGLPNM